MNAKTTTTPAVKSASVTLLLEKSGFATTDAIFDSLADEDRNSARTSVAMRLWMAFNDFECAEKDYAQSLSSIAADCNRQIENVAKGNTADASWVLHYAKQTTEAAAKMKSSTDMILTMSAILAKLV